MGTLEKLVSLVERLAKVHDVALVWFLLLLLNGRAIVDLFGEVL